MLPYNRPVYFKIDTDVNWRLVDFGSSASSIPALQLPHFINADDLPMQVAFDRRYLAFRYAFFPPWMASATFADFRRGKIFNPRSRPAVSNFGINKYWFVVDEWNKMLKNFLLIDKFLRDCKKSLVFVTFDKR